MNKFWFATFGLQPGLALAATQPDEETPIGPIAAIGTGYLAMEVLKSQNDDDDNWAVLFSKVDALSTPRTLTCVVGFTNVAKACNLWLDRGFPLVDATIVHKDGVLTVVSPRFTGDGSLMVYDEVLFSVEGIDPSKAGSNDDTLDTTYGQFFQTPDAVQPDTLVARVPHNWRPTRTNVRAVDSGQLPTIRFSGISARCPSLAPLQADDDFKPYALWTGDVTLPTPPSPGELPPKVKPEKVPPVFGTPAFRFEDVEILGFRIDLSALDPDVVTRALAQLVAPLNFHLLDRTARPGYISPDFRYRVATSTIVIELLRYGRMKSRDPQPPLRIDDSQSQHELLVRVLVGRVDDDSAQAHDPATFVPAIFVDNPWSKALGRDSVGYDKRLANFCITGAQGLERLLPDGRVVGSTGSAGEHEVLPLGAISHVSLVERTGHGGGPPVIEFDYSTADHLDPSALLPIDLDLTFGVSALAGARWRQTDFADGEFRRSFAQLAIADSIRTFRSIQPAPVGRRPGLDPAWITGTFVLDPDIRVALPLGSATLTFHQQHNEAGKNRPAAPAAWNQLCQLLDGLDPEKEDKKAAPSVTVLPGSWYRLLCSMNLTIDDGLDFAPWVTDGRVSESRARSLARSRVLPL